jgi:hypothetical protein
MTLPSLDDSVTRRADVLARETPDGAVLVDMMSGRAWELNRVGAALWSLLATPATLRQVCRVLGERYAVERAVLARDVTKLADDLIQAGLIVVARGEPALAP